LNLIANLIETKEKWKLTIKMKKTTSKTKPLTKELSSNEVENIEPNTITIVVLITPNQYAYRRSNCYVYCRAPNQHKVNDHV